jgi:16S rRNA (cytosine1402-N4)-methyltransferase
MGSKGRVIGIDRDPETAVIAKRNLTRFGGRAEIVVGHYADLDSQLDRLGISEVDGVLFDLGVSSFHLDLPDRGFSFRADAPLDMRFDRTSGITAAQIVNQWSERELKQLFKTAGDERRPGLAARAIIRKRVETPITTTGQLSAILERALGASRDGINPSTRVFQALRIAVNGELERLEEALEKAAQRLRPGGRLAVISYHSGEDRIAKTTIRRLSAACVCPPRFPVCVCDTKPLLAPVTRKALLASAEEVAANPRARSAKLRVAERRA